MADDKLSRDQMIIESYLTLKQIEKRLDRHGAEHREDMEKIWGSLKEIGTKHVELSEDHGERLTKLESERTLLAKLVHIVIALFGGGAGGWLGKHL